MKNFYLLFTLFFFFSLSTKSQVLFTNANTAYTQNFNNIGPSATATMPTNWRVSKSNSIATVTNFATATFSTEYSAGNNMSNNDPDGIYNFGAGLSSSATDRAVGGLSTASGSKSVNIFLHLKNTGTSSINGFNISYNIEKYKNGTNGAGFTMQMYYSGGGITWNNAGSNFRVSTVGSDIDNNGFTNAPQGSTNINDVLNINLGAGNEVYLAWNYTVTSGTTTSNAVALALDDVSIAANYNVVAPVTIGSFNASLQNNQAKINWTTYSEINMENYELEKSNDGINFQKLTTVISNNVLSVSQYNYTDGALFNGNNFYRIKSIEKSGFATYSNTIKLFNGKQSGIRIHPTIVNTGSFNIQLNNLPKGNYEIMLYNTAGVQMLKKVITNEVQGTISQTINLPSGASKGLYIVTVYGKDINVNQKIVVQ